MRVPAPQADAHFEAALTVCLAEADPARARAALTALEAAAAPAAPLYNAHGILSLREGQPRAALDWFAQAVAAAPDAAEYHGNLGVALEQAGEPARAMQSYHAALDLDPAHSVAALQLGLLFSGQARFQEAHACLWQCGRALVARTRNAEAAALFATLVRILPRDVDALIVLGSLYLDLEHLEAARQAFDQALALAPDHPAALNARGLVAAGEGELDAARRWLRRAVAAQAIFPEARNNLGNVAARLGDALEAIRNYRLAVAQRPDYADAWLNLADELAFAGQREEAAAALETCLARAPGNALARLRRAYLRLAAGDYATGWTGHEWRVAAFTGDDYLPAPAGAGRLPRPSTWAAGDLAGRTLLVLAEEGLGDELFCLRFAPALAARGVRLLYRPSVKLRPLLTATPGLAGLVEEGVVPRHDFALGVGDLGLVAWLQGLPPEPPPLPLVVVPEQQEAMRSELAANAPGPWLGVTWRAGKVEDGPRRKLVPLDELARTLARWPGSLVALQRDASAEEVAALAAHSGRPVVAAAALAEEPARALPLLALLDRYVAVSNTLVHLRASLGRDSDVLVQVAGEWRWREAGDTSPWFPDVCIHRQGPRGRWQPALASLATRLQRSAS